MRFEKGVRDVPGRSNVPVAHCCTYPVIPVDINTPNENAYVLAALCSDNNMVVLNHLKCNGKHFVSKKTKKSEWISELDCVIASQNPIENLHYFAVHQTDWLPSDHAPISFEQCIHKPSLECLFDRASSLSGHVTFPGQQCNVRKVNSPVKLDNISVNEFSNCFLSFPTPSTDSDIDTFAGEISDTQYMCTVSCGSNTVKSGGESGEGEGDIALGNTGCWKRLLRDHDDARVWRAVD